MEKRLVEKFLKWLRMDSESQIGVTRKKWFEDHPKFKEIQSYGYHKENPTLSRVAMLAYLDLCEAKHWFSVKVHPCESLKLVYITGKRTKKTEMQTIVPLDIKTSLTMEEIQTLIREVNACENGSREVGGTEIPETEESESVTLAICESDSTIAYYDLFNGLVPPKPPEASEEPRNKGGKRKWKSKKNLTSKS